MAPFNLGPARSIAYAYEYVNKEQCNEPRIPICVALLRLNVMTIEQGQNRRNAWRRTKHAGPGQVRPVPGEWYQRLAGPASRTSAVPVPAEF
jgi:hypothetical protein